MSDTEREYHPCTNIDYNSLYVTMLRAALKLAENGEFKDADELWASAVGIRAELFHCQSLHTGTQQSEEGEQ